MEGQGDDQGQKPGTEQGSSKGGQKEAGVRQAAVALLATQVKNSECVSALFATLLTINKELHDATTASDVVVGINNKLDGLKESLRAVTGDQEQLEQVYESLNDDLSRLLTTLEPLNKIIPRITKFEDELEDLLNKVGEVGALMDRITELEKRLAECKKRDRPGPASKKKN